MLQSLKFKKLDVEQDDNEPQNSLYKYTVSFGAKKSTQLYASFLDFSKVDMVAHITESY